MPVAFPASLGAGDKKEGKGRKGKGRERKGKKGRGRGGQGRRGEGRVLFLASQDACIQVGRKTADVGQSSV
jgi:hypothetical protein